MNTDRSGSASFGSLSAALFVALILLAPVPRATLEFTFTALTLRSAEDLTPLLPIPAKPENLVINPRHEVLAQILEMK